jgi:hypothetical protein
MPNINVTVSDSTYREARIWAAIHNTNVSQVVREFLDMVAHDSVRLLQGAANPPAERIEAIASTFNDFSDLPVIQRTRPDKYIFQQQLPKRNTVRIAKNAPPHPHQPLGNWETGSSKHAVTAAAQPDSETNQLP